MPFIARYRKESSGALEEPLGYLRELEERREAVLASIEEQGKLTDALRGEIEHAETKARLEDLHLPYKPKRRTKAQIAREAGLEPLADQLLNDPIQAPEHTALGFVDVDMGVADVVGALEGARSILSERFSEEPALVGELREWFYEYGRIHARVVSGKENDGAKFRDYFDFVDGLVQIPSHRTLALFRARAEGVLDLDLEPVPVKRNDARGGSDATLNAISVARCPPFPPPESGPRACADCRW